MKQGWHNQVYAHLQRIAPLLFSAHCAYVEPHTFITTSYQLIESGDAMMVKITAYSLHGYSVNQDMRINFMHMGEDIVELLVPALAKAMQQLNYSLIHKHFASEQERQILR